VADSALGCSRRGGVLGGLSAYRVYI